jgi:predicted DNA-binding transcriptional regulator AlpA
MAEGKVIMNSLLHLYQLARLCQVDAETIRDWIDLGFVPRPVRVGPYLRWRSSDLDAWLTAGCPRGPVPTDEEIAVWDEADDAEHIVRWLPALETKETQ